MTDDKFRHLRAVLRSAAIWGAAWAIAGGTLVTVVSLFDPSPGIESLICRRSASVIQPEFSAPWLL